MTREPRIYLIAATTLIVGLLMACAAEAEPTPPAPAPAAAQVPAPPPTAALPAAAQPASPTPTPQPSESQMITSDIANSALQDLTVNVGTTVTWTNKDGAPHTTTSGAPGSTSGLWDSSTLSRDRQFSYTFDQVGTFPYFCKIHTYMIATVTVVESGAPASGQAPSGGQTPTTGSGDGY